MDPKLMFFSCITLDFMCPNLQVLIATDIIHLSTLYTKSEWTQVAISENYLIIVIWFFCCFVCMILFLCIFVLLGWIYFCWHSCQNGKWTGLITWLKMHDVLWRKHYCLLVVLMLSRTWRPTPYLSGLQTELLFSLA